MRIEPTRIASDEITDLKPNEIFVFGSNEAGRHGKGAAKTALKKWGAIYGQAEGLQGQTYAIPTVDVTVSRKLPLNEIKQYVKRFIEFAKLTPHNSYLVTEIGCGLAGYTVKDIAPLFKDALNITNIYLPKSFIPNLFSTMDKLDFIAGEGNSFFVLECNLHRELNMNVEEYFASVNKVDPSLLTMLDGDMVQLMIKHDSIVLLTFYNSKKGAMDFAAHYNMKEAIQKVYETVFDNV